MLVYGVIPDQFHPWLAELWSRMPSIRPTGAGYEFSPEENKIFQRLVSNLSRSGLVVVIASLILLAYLLSDS